jgi:hypothetical protein
MVPNQDLLAHDPAFKIVGNIWYIAAYMPNEMIRGFSANQMRTVYIENPVTGEFLPLTMRVDRITPGTRDSRVVFRSTRYVIDFMHRRNVNIRTTQSVETGLKIPNTAVASRQYYIIPLTFLHGIIENSVLRFSEEGNVSVPVTVAEWAGAYVHIRGDGLELAVGDILLDGLGGRHELRDVRTVQGVYRVNTGVADFRVIHTDAPITERGGSTLLCPVRNQRSLNEFDSIVVDADMVTEGQIIW